MSEIRGNGQVKARLERNSKPLNWKGPKVNGVTIIGEHLYRPGLSFRDRLKSKGRPGFLGAQIIM